MVEDWDSYEANSPIHHIQNMETPLLMMFGTNDGAVEYNQGVEFYNAARRLGKQMVMLSYDGENHGLAREPTSSIISIVLCSGSVTTLRVSQLLTGFRPVCRPRHSEGSAYG